MKKTVVLFDIDYTLFNARKYRERFTAQLAEHLQYPGTDFALAADKVYAEHRKEYAYFDPEVFAKRLSDRLSTDIDPVKVKEIIASEQTLEASLYDDSISVLSDLASHKELTLGIFSAGLLHVQRPKIRPLEKFLQKDHIHIYEFKKQHALPELMEKYKNDHVIIIDDMLDVLFLAKENHTDVHTVWIRRPEAKSSLVDNFKPDSIIKTLHEVIPIVLGMEG